MKKKIILFFIVLLNLNFLLSHSLSGMDFEEWHSKLEITSDNKNYFDGKNFFFGIKIVLNSGWKTYWKNPGDSGASISIDWLDKQNINSFEVLYPYPESFLDHEVITIGYDQSVLFPIKLELIDDKNAVEGLMKINYLVCKEICIPVSLEKKINVSNVRILNDKKTELFETISNLPSINKNFFKISDIFKSKPNKFNFTVNSLKDSKVDNLSVFAHSSQDHLKVETKTHGKRTKVSVSSDNKIITPFSNIQIVVSDGFFFEQFNINEKDIKHDNYILKMIIFALLGGFILNFMPCVLPILSLKIFSFLNLREKKQLEIYRISSLTILGIMTSFLIISLITIILKQIGLNFGWGSQFQSKEFLMIFSFLLLFFSLNLFGFFELSLPQKFLNVLNINVSNNKGIDAFFSGALATSLATPCTAPFLGTSIGFAISQNNFIIILIFLSLGIGFSIPYFLIIFSPKLLNLLPKPGKWMNDMKKILAFSVFVTSLWLLKLFGIKEEILIVTFFIIPLLSLVFLETKNIRNISSTLVIVLIISLIFLKSNTNQYEKNWNKFEEVLVRENIKKGKIVFVDITADWCITCKVNKITTLDKTEVINYFNESNVILYRADWTNKDISILNFLQQNERYGIPFNIIYGPSLKKGIVLPEVLSRDTILNSINLVK